MAKKKKKRVFKVKNIIIILSTLILLAIIIYHLITMPINNIYIKGNNLITDDEILESTNLYNYPSFLFTNKKKLEKNIKKNEYIKNVNIRKKLGNIIEIKITEYKPLAIDTNGNVIMENSKRFHNIYNLTDIPILINEITTQNVNTNFSNKFKTINTNILRQISQIEYSPIEVDDDRFILYMNDSNIVYITLSKIDKLNKYNQIKDALEGKKGIIYLDSGNYVEIKG